MKTFPTSKEREARDRAVEIPLYDLGSRRGELNAPIGLGCLKSYLGINQALEQAFQTMSKVGPRRTRSKSCR